MTVTVQAWDTVFVRARRRDVHPLLVDVEGYGRWWPGATVRRVDSGVVLDLRPPGWRPRRHRVVAALTRERPGLGVELRYRGELAGDAEWYYLDEPTGVVVAYLAKAAVAERGWRRLLRGHRAAVRAALHALKDGLEDGRAPGAEPDAALVAHQRAVLAESRARGLRPAAADDLRATRVSTPRREGRS